MLLIHMFLLVNGNLAGVVDSLIEQSSQSLPKYATRGRKSLMSEDKVKTPWYAQSNSNNIC